MTAIDDATDHGQLMQAVADYGRALDYWVSRCGVAEQDRDDFARQLRDARDLIAERNGVVRRVCAENAVLKTQLASANARVAGGVR